MGDALTYLAHRSILPGESLAKEYSYGDISSFPATGTVNPGDTESKYYSEEYSRLHHDLFNDWHLSIEGAVNKPGMFTLRELQKLPSKKQITRHTCEEGWTAIAEWIGVPLGILLQYAGVKSSARFVNCYAYDGYMESIDMLDAFHPQTIISYGMNGHDLPLAHGAPVRLRVETQIGYKSVKYLKRILVSEKFVDVGDTGWSWYTGI
ncbi:MAG: molybdopterin-dependent oxidoreductase [Saprospiraceae bacterium]|nr:molybdopterin-dependent oxidoreductase [Saprospiraceae bacterium]